MGRMTEPVADIGVVGLAVMGSNLARNLARNNNRVAIYNRSSEKTEHLVLEHPEAEFIPTFSYEEFAASLTRPRTAVIMVQAGAGTDAVINELVRVFEPGDIIVDGGNAHFPDTIRREKAVRETGINFVGTGISGGEEGALNGPSIMPGGSDEAWVTLGPILRSIAAVAEGEPCVTHIGHDGAGHFVKMVHNGIEYADMQLIAEAYDLIRRGTGKTPAQIADVFAEWNKGELKSYLVEITSEVLRQNDAATGEALVDVILDEAGAKGTGAWTVQVALDLGVPASGIAEAVFARSLSSQRAQRDAAVGLPGPVPSDQEGFAHDAEKLRGAGPPRAVRVEDRGLLAGLRHHPRRRCRLRLGDRPRGRLEDLARWVHHPRPVPQPDRGRLRRSAGPAGAALGPVLRRGARPGTGRMARGRDGRRARGHPRPGVRVVAGLLRRAARRPAACRPGAGSARLLRRAHLQACGPRRRLPHRVVRRPLGDPLS